MSVYRFRCYRNIDNKIQYSRNRVIWHLFCMLMILCTMFDNLKVLQRHFFLVLIHLHIRPAFMVMCGIFHKAKSHVAFSTVQKCCYHTAHEDQANERTNDRDMQKSVCTKVAQPHGMSIRKFFMSFILCFTVDLCFWYTEGNIEKARVTVNDSKNSKSAHFVLLHKIVAIL